MRGLCCFLVAFSLTFSAGLAFAVDDWIVTAESGNFYSRNVTPASAIKSNTTFAAKAMVTASPVVYTAREVTYARATAAGLLRFAASPAGLVTTVALQAFFEWFKNNGNDILPDGTPMLPAGNGTHVGTVTYASGGCTTSTSLSSLMSCATSRCVAAGYTGGVSFAWTSSTMIRAYSDYPSLGRYHYNCQSISVTGSGPGYPTEETEINPSVIPASWAPYVNTTETVAASPMTNDDFFSELEGSPYGSNSDTLGDVFEDANGRPWDTPEIKAKRKEIRDELTSQSGGDPSTLPDPGTGTSGDPSNPDAPSSQPDGWSSTPSGGASGKTEVTKLPDFCGWAQIVCDWIGWTQEVQETDTPPALPVVPSQAGTWDSGLSSGSCPPPVIISALGASVPISWQPACDFVGMLRPILIAFAGIAAALILLGQRAGGAG